MTDNYLDVTLEARAAIEEMNARRGDKAMLALRYVLAVGFILAVAALLSLVAVLAVVLGG